MNQSGRIIAADLGAYVFGEYVVHARWLDDQDIIQLNIYASFFSPTSVGAGHNYLFTFNSDFGTQLTLDDF